MNINSLYLAHPLSERHAVREWELDFESRTGIMLANPFYDYEQRAEIVALDSGQIRKRETKTGRQGLKIVKRDLELIYKQNGLIAFLEEGLTMVGTPMEIFYNTHVLKRPSFVISQTLSHHPWIQGLAYKTFKSEAGFEEYLWKNKQWK